MTSMLRQSKAMRARFHAYSGESLLGRLLGGLVGGYQASNDNAFLGAIEKRFLRRVEREPKPAHAQILYVGNALNQSVVNRVWLAQRSKFDSLSSHDDSVPVGVVVVIAEEQANHGLKPDTSNPSRLAGCMSQFVTQHDERSVNGAAA